jgi:hypothetical protein
MLSGKWRLAAMALDLSQADHDVLDGFLNTILDEPSREPCRQIVGFP